MSRTLGDKQSDRAYEMQFGSWADTMRILKKKSVGKTRLCALVRALAAVALLMLSLSCALGGSREGRPPARTSTAAPETLATVAPTPCPRPTSGGEGPAPSPNPKTYSEPPPVTISADKKYAAIVETTKGTLTIELRPDLALKTVNSFVFLACEDYFDGLTFHRVIPGFIAQTGDRTCGGGPGYALPDEFSDEPYVRGTVGVACGAGFSAGTGSQWFITYSDQHQDALNGQYTVFGMVVDGMDVVDRLSQGDEIINVEIMEN